MTPSESPLSQVKWVKMENEPQQLRDFSAPIPRHGHRAVAYENRMIVYGGGNNSIINEVHVFDPKTGYWFRPNPTGEIPPGCAAHGLAVDGSRLLLFGGMMEQNRYSNDLYELNIDTWEWKKLQPSTFGPYTLPRKRFGHSFTAFPGLGRIYLFGGLANDGEDDRYFIPCYLNDLYVLHTKENLDHGMWDMPVTVGQPPFYRESHSAVRYQSRGFTKLIIYGGMCSFRLGDLHVLDLDTACWSSPQMKGTLPSPRSLHTATVIDEKMYVFGGWTPLPVNELQQDISRPFQCTSTISSLNLETLTWDEPLQGEKIPEARAGHSAVLINSRIYIWSGRDKYWRTDGSLICLDDFWQLQVKKPRAPMKVQLARTCPNVLEVSWTPVPEADSYILQCTAHDQELEPGYTSSSSLRSETNSKELVAASCSSDSRNPSGMTMTSVLMATKSTPTSTQQEIIPECASLQKPSPPISMVLPFPRKSMIVSSSSYAPANLAATASSLVPSKSSKSKLKRPANPAGPTSRSGGLLRARSPTPGHDQEGKYMRPDKDIPKSKPKPLPTIATAPVTTTLTSSRTSSGTVVNPHYMNMRTMHLLAAEAEKKRNAERMLLPYQSMATPTAPTTPTGSIRRYMYPTGTISQNPITIAASGPLPGIGLGGKVVTIGQGQGQLNSIPSTISLSTGGRYFGYPKSTFTPTVGTIQVQAPRQIYMLPPPQPQPVLISGQGRLQQGLQRITENTPLRVYGSTPALPQSQIVKYTLLSTGNASGSGSRIIAQPVRMLTPNEIQGEGQSIGEIDSTSSPMPPPQQK